MVKSIWDAIGLDEPMVTWVLKHLVKAMPQSPFGPKKQVDAWMGLVILTRSIGNAIAIAGSLKQVECISKSLYFDATDENNKMHKNEKSQQPQLWHGIQHPA